MLVWNDWEIAKVIAELDKINQMKMRITRPYKMHWQISMRHPGFRDMRKEFMSFPAIAGYFKRGG